MSGHGGGAFEEEHEPHENHERYLLTYADMITLLMALFIILFAIGQTDIAKYKQFQSGLQKEFGAPAIDGGTGINEGSVNPISENSINVLTKVNPGLVDPRDLTTGGNYDGKVAGTGTGTPKGSVEINDYNIDESAQTVKKALEQAGLTTDQVKVQIDTRGLVLVLSTDGVAFTSGSAVLRSEAGPTLELVSHVIALVTNKITVEGHTDSQPMSGPGGNWSLSGNRAAAVVQYLEGKGLAADRFAVAGYADTHPAGDNATAAGRAKNRRVEIVVTTHDQIRDPLDLRQTPSVVAARITAVAANPAAPAPVDLRSQAKADLVTTTTTAPKSAH
jgi:chemotaxis protein MotB